MSQTLYRKYRPATFADLVGQEHIKSILLSEVTSGHVSHAYLFSGPRGCGKTTTARLLAKALNCHRRLDNGEPCNDCVACQEITAGRNQDVIEIDAASNRRIDEMRQLREEVKYLPGRDKYKVYIVDEAHMLTNEAFNAFLKTLEEPPAHIVFILATTEIAKIPETIFSRCQHFAFTKLPFSQMMERLERLAVAENVVVDKEVLEEVVRRSSGALRDAESMLGQLLSLGKKQITSEDASLFLPKVGFAKAISWFAKLVDKNGTASLNELSALEGQGINLEFFLGEVLELGRQLLLYKITSQTEPLAWHYSNEEIKVLTDLAARADLSIVRSIVVNLLRASQDMRLSPELPILPLELAVVNICEGEEKRTANSVQPIGAERGMPGNVVNSKTMPEIQTTETASPAVRREGGFRTPLPVETKDVKYTNTKVSNHSLEDILSGWGEVLSRIKNKNHALNFILGVAEPMAVNGNTVEIGFKYRLQQEKVSEYKNREIIETVLHEVYGSRFLIQPSLKEDIKVKTSALGGSALGGKEAVAAQVASDEEILVKTALEVFEGAVVEN